MTKIITLEMWEQGIIEKEISKWLDDTGSREQLLYEIIYYEDEAPMDWFNRLRNCNKQDEYAKVEYLDSLEDDMWDWYCDYDINYILDGLIELFLEEKEYEITDIIDDEDYISSEIREYMRDSIEWYQNYEGLLENTKIRFNITPEQFYNQNYEYGLTGETRKKIIQMYNNERDEYFDDYEVDPFIIKLIESQGYEIEDFNDREKVDNSKFLTSLIDEYDNLPTNYAYFTILLEMNGKEFVDMYFDGESIELNSKQDYVMGFFQNWGGTGSLLDVQLEKDVTFSLEDVRIELEDSDNFGYSVNEVYGLVGNAWSKHFKVNYKEQE